MPVFLDLAWHPDDVQNWIDSRCLYRSDLPDIHLLENGYECEYIITIDGFSSPETIYPATNDVEEARALFDALKEMIGKREHPYAHKPTEYRKPRDLFEAQAFLLRRGSNIGIREGVPCSGPGEKLDHSVSYTGAMYATKKGMYTIGSFHRERSLQQSVLLTKPDGEYVLSKDDVFSEILDDIELCRDFSLYYEREPENITRMLRAYQTKYDLISEEATSINQNNHYLIYSPDSRESWTALCDESGFIPYRGLSYSSGDYSDDTHLILLGKTYTLPFTEEQHQRYKIHFDENILDPYEIAEVFYRQDPDILEEMLTRNDGFYAAYREQQKEYEISEDLLASLNPEQQDRVLDLHSKGYLPSNVFRNLEYLQRQNNSESVRAQMFDGYLAPYTEREKLYASREVVHSR